MYRDIDTNSNMFFDSYIVAELIGRYLSIIERNENREFDEEDDEILKDLFDLPFSKAIDFLMSKTPQIYDKLDKVTDNALDDYFWIKKSTDLEVTKKIQNKLLKSLEEGKTYFDFKNELDLESLGLGENGHYWKSAYDMNMAFAQSRGQYEEQLEGIEYGFEYGLFDAILDGRETQTCHNLDGKVMLLEDWIKQGLYPPLHYRCRSRIIAITKEDVEDMGLTVEKKKQHAHVQGNFGKFSTRKRDLKKLYSEKENEVEKNKKEIDFKFMELSNKNSIEKNQEKGIIKIGKKLSKNLTEEEHKALVDVLKNAPENMKKLWNKYSDKFNLYDRNSEKNSYNPLTKRIKINGKFLMGSSAKKPFERLVHEIGHHIDNLIGSEGKLLTTFSFISANYFSEKHKINLRDMLIKEYWIYYNEIKNKLNTERENKIFEEMGREFSGYSSYQKSIISDLFSGITKNEVTFGSGHKTDYWENENALPAEAFAHFTGALITNNEGVELIKRYFPKSLEIYNEIINNTVKGGK